MTALTSVLKPVMYPVHRVDAQHKPLRPNLMGGWRASVILPVGLKGPRSQFCFKNASPYIGSVTYSSAASEPAFDFDTPLLCWLARIVVSDIADWASSGTDEPVSLSFEGCESPPSDVRRATTAESPMTSDGFVSGPTPSRLAAIVLRRFTKRVDETIARSAIRMMIAP